MIIKNSLNKSRLFAELNNRLYFYKQTDSTMEEAKRLLKSQDLADGDLLVAASQTSGKGRRGRGWISPKGGIWLSYIALPKLKREEYTLYSIMVAVSLHQCLLDCGVKTEVKWPNDIIIENKKLAGIAIDLITQNKDYLIIGVGINIFNPIIEIATRLNDHLDGVDINEILISLVEQIDYHKNLLEDDKQLILNKWRKNNNVLDKIVKIIPVDNKQPYLAKAIDIDSKGALIIEVNKKRSIVVAADVSLRIN